MGQSGGSRPVSRVLSRTVIHLGCVSPHTSSNLPRNSGGALGTVKKPACSSIWSCSGWGLPCHHCCQRRGALLPHHFTLTNDKATGGIFSVALSVGFRLPGVTWHPARRSPDFPLHILNHQAAATVWPTPSAHFKRLSAV